MLAILTLMVLASSGSAVHAYVPDYTLVSPSVETDPMPDSGDSADDPAVWPHPTDPARSLVLVNNKQGSLDVYNLSGALLQRISDGTPFWGNVDVRTAVTVGQTTRDLVAVAHRGIQFYGVDPGSRRLASVTEGTSISSAGEGLCLYRSATSGRTYVFIITRAGLLRQYAITDNDADGRWEGSQVRSLQVGSEAEGCVADDATGDLYVAEEDVALWRYDAEPGGGSSRRVVDGVHGTVRGGALAADVEGVTLLDAGRAGKWVIASAQRVANPSSSYFVAYRVLPGGGWAFDRAFRVGDGPNADDCDKTDGITVYHGNLGAAFPHGLFACQDNSNRTGSTQRNQDVKLVPIERIFAEAAR